MRSPSDQHFFRTVLLLALMAFMPGATAFGQTVVLSSLGNSIDEQSSVSFGSWIANSFITDTNAWRLNTVAVSIFSAPNSSGNFALSIWTDNGSGTSPGSQMEVLTGNANPNPGSGSSTFSYTAAGPGLAVEPNTKYWLVAGVTAGSGAYKWNYSLNPEPLAVGVWSIPLQGTYIGSSDQGASWGTASGGDPYMFSMSATLVPVPEPSTLVMGLAGITYAGWVLMRRRTSVAG